MAGQRLRPDWISPRACKAVSPAAARRRNDLLEDLPWPPGCAFLAVGQFCGKTSRSEKLGKRSLCTTTALAKSALSPGLFSWEGHKEPTQHNGGRGGGGHRVGEAGVSPELEPRYRQSSSQVERWVPSFLKGGPEERKS